MHQTDPAPLLVSHPLCPYVQRVAIVAAEVGTPLRRETIQLAAKPEWFTTLSPTGKTPMLVVGGEALFESAAIAEYLNEAAGGSLLPEGLIARARARAWIEFASGTLGEIAALYNGPDATSFDAAAARLTARFERLDGELEGPWFTGPAFGMVDAAFAPVFRYLDVLETQAKLELAPAAPTLTAWRARLAQRPSVVDAVAPDFPDHLLTFFLGRDSYLSRLIQSAAARSDRCGDGSDSG